jgi:hypothetical protein
MNDSLLLDLFSPKTLSYILYPDNHLSREVMIVLWCLLVTALTLSEISTQTSIGLLEIGFRMLVLYAELVEPVEGDPDRFPWLALLPRHAKTQAVLYTLAPRFGMC